MKKVKPKIKKRNPAVGIKNDINKLIEILEDLKITLSKPTSPFYNEDLKDASFGIEVLSTEIRKKI
jgi:hypothetical protein